MMTEESFVKLITNEIGVAMQEHNKAMANGDSVASCINMGMVGGLTSALEVRGHHVISTHSPLRGETSRTLILPGQSDFNPLPSARGDWHASGS